jgi:hypothetical protein
MERPTTGVGGGVRGVRGGVPGGARAHQGGRRSIAVSQSVQVLPARDPSRAKPPALESADGFRLWRSKGTRR